MSLRKAIETGKKFHAQSKTEKELTQKRKRVEEYELFTQFM